MKKVKALAAAALVAASLLSMQGAAMAAEANTIAVRGVAKQEVAPDMAYVTLGINVKADTAEAARNQAAEASQKVRRALLGLAITEAISKVPATTCIPTTKILTAKAKKKAMHSIPPCASK